jgi:hypothetical protein
MWWVYVGLMEEGVVVSTIWTEGDPREMNE